MQDGSTKNDTRDRILDAVDRLLGRFGYQKMTMDDVAQEADLGRRTLYLYFSSKEAMTLASIDRVVERLLERLTGLAGADLSPDRRLRVMLRTRILFRLDSVREYREGLETLFAALRPAYLARRERYFDAEARVFAGVLEEGVRLGVIACEDSLETAHTLLVATNALLPYSLSPRELGTREEIEARIDRLADLLLVGLCSRETVPERTGRAPQPGDGSASPCATASS